MATTQKYFVSGPPTNLANFVSNAGTISWTRTTCNGREAILATYDDELVGTADLVSIMGESGLVVDEPV